MTSSWILSQECLLTHLVSSAGGGLKPNRGSGGLAGRSSSGDPGSEGGTPYRLLGTDGGGEGSRTAAGGAGGIGSRMAIGGTSISGVPGGGVVPGRRSWGAPGSGGMDRGARGGGVAYVSGGVGSGAGGGLGGGAGGGLQKRRMDC